MASHSSHTHHHLHHRHHHHHHPLLLIGNLSEQGLNCQQGQLIRAMLSLLGTSDESAADEACEVLCFLFGEQACSSCPCMLCATYITYDMTFARLSIFPRGLEWGF